MSEYQIKSNSKKIILALGAESAGNFSVFHDGKIYHSKDFGDLLSGDNLLKFKKAVSEYLKKNRIKPDIIITDLHPLYKTTEWGRELAKKHKAKFIQIQHHVAHIFSAIGDSLLADGRSPLAPLIKACLSGRQGGGGGCFGIAMDGTGYGEDGKIWGGEVFAISNFQFPISKQISNSKKQYLKIERIGKLENQVLIGGELAIREPARMLIAILVKTAPLIKGGEGGFKDYIYKFVKKYYSRNQFELLYNQLEQNFNCVETSSTGRILDAVSLLLGFCNNERKYKHEPIDLLEKNSTKPYPIKLPPLLRGDRGDFILPTTPLFEYLIKNLHKDKKRLAATAQLYLAKGLQEIIKKQKLTVNLPAGRQGCKLLNVVIAGGIANNKIISSYFKKQGVFLSKKIPRGDAGLSFGQAIYCLSFEL